MMNLLQRLRSDETGSITAELAIMLPFMLLLVFVSVVAGEIALQESSARSASTAAARSASKHTTQAGATTAAITAAQNNQGHCDSVTVTVQWVPPTTASAASPAIPGTVTTTVRCTRQLGPAAFSLSPRVIEHQSSAALEAFRSS